MRNIKPLEIRFLLDEERRTYDWTGAGTNWVRAFPATGKWSGKPSRFYKKDPEWFYDRYYTRILTNLGDKHRPYTKYVDEMRPKVVQQGGVIGLDLMQEMCHSYYENVPNSISPDINLIRARDSIIRDLKLKIARYGYPQDVPIAYGSTQAGLHTFSHKDTFTARSSYDQVHWHHITANIAGQRISDKPRIIFMDGIGNYAHYQPLLTKCREWLKQYYPQEFDAWRNPNLTMRHRITKLLDAGYTSIELDYKKMDQWFSWPLVEQFILPIYEVLLTPGEYLRFAAMTEEYFTQELFWGNELWTGEHTLFSGIPPTNDFETLWDWIFAKALEFIIKVLMESFKLGDDLSLLAKCDFAKAQDLVKIAIDLACSVNLRLHEDEKNRVAVGDFRFLKRLYYKGGLRDSNGDLISAYPGNILLRNVLQPERPRNQCGIAACADLQRCDGLYGSPDYSQVVDLLMSNTKHQFVDITPEDVEAFSASDWWVKMYGERWDPTASITYHHLMKTGSKSIR